MICFLKDHYVLGACISAYTHKQYINKLNLNVHVVIMCDKYIYDKYNKLLSKYFDRVIKIKLRSFKLSESYNFVKHKYNSWIRYSLSKWTFLKYEEYNKILFIDIDILPNNIHFYDLFHFNTPAFYNQNKNRICENSKPFQYNINFSYNEYIKNLWKKIGSIDGGICLFTPSKQIYKEYVTFSNELYKNGIYSILESGPDETSLFYFSLKKYKKLTDICNEYSVIPWDHPEFVKDAKAYNFLSWFKPWIKPLFLCWKEESLWRDIYNIMPHYENIEELLYKCLIEYIYKLKSIKNRKTIKRTNNLEFMRKYKKDFKKVFISTNLKNIKLLESKIIFDDYGILNKKKITKNNFVQGN